MTVATKTETASQNSKHLSVDTVPLRNGPPTREELFVYYPAKFTFQQLKTFINSGCACLLYLKTSLEVYKWLEI